MRLLTLIACLFALLLPLAPQLALAQDETVLLAQEGGRRSLFDMLFGPSEPQRQQAQPQRSTPRAAPSGSSSPSVTSLPPPEPKTEKSPTATRLAVFGDSMAVDLARALDRFYADDPNLVVIERAVGSSGFVRDDFFDWNAAIADAIASNTFDLAVITIGINDRQAIGNARPLTDEWKAIYSERLSRFLGQLRAAGKPVVWVGLPPMEAPTYSAAMTQISSLHRVAAFAGGAEFVDIYERFTNEAGNFSSYGPDLNGQNVLMRKSDGIHFSAAGADKVVFSLSQALRLYYRGGLVSIAVADPLAGTDAALMVRLPFQGAGQIRLLDVAGPVVPLTGGPRRSAELLEAGPLLTEAPAFDLDQLLLAPAGRVDAFGVGIVRSDEPEPATAESPDLSAAGPSVP